MGWCNNVFDTKNYNKLINIKKFLNMKNFLGKITNMIILFQFNIIQKKENRERSAIFIHLTKDYKNTAGCIALKKKDFLILLKLIKKNSIIKIN